MNFINCYTLTFRLFIWHPSSHFLALSLSEVTHEGRLAGVKSAHSSALEDGEPVDEAGRDEGLEHHDKHLGAGHLLLGQSARPAGHLLAALLSTYQGTNDVHNPVEDKT